MATDAPSKGWFAAPAPIRTLFKRFPLRTYDSQPLATSSCPPPSSEHQPRLYVFSRSDAEAAHGTPSYNPSCLKWQTLLRIAGVDVCLVRSSNHASPSGALPFLIPTDETKTPLTGDKIAAFAALASPPAAASPPSSKKRDSSRKEKKESSNSNNTKKLDPNAPRLAAYQALISQRIRPAWLHELYLVPENDEVLSSLYLPSSLLLRVPQRMALREAATAEILKTTRRAGAVDAKHLRTVAKEAFSAFSTFLGEDDWFFGEDAPGVLDAELFAYTHLILDDAMGWHDLELAKIVLEFENVVRHRDRLYKRCWSN